MRVWCKWIVIGWMACGLADGASAASVSAADWLNRLFTQGHYDPAWFAPAVTKAIAPDALAKTLQDLTTRFGAYRGLTQTGGKLTARFDRVLAPVQLAFDDQGRIAQLNFGEPTPLFTDGSQAMAAFARLPGHVALLVTRNGQTLLANDADQPEPVGSAFKLAVLAATQDAVAQGRLGWGQSLALKSSWQAPPTGILPQWPNGIAVTVETLAGLMISQSDNVAADGLIDLVGRDKVEAFAPGNRPLLTPREYFQLSAYDQTDRRGAFLNGDEAQRRAILAELDKADAPDVAAYSATAHPGLGWQLSARDLCGLLERVHAAPAMHINPGLAAPAEWREVAFKGGEVVGAYNLSTRVETVDGATACVVATWTGDSPHVDPGFNKAYIAVLDWVRSRR